MVGSWTKVEEEREGFTLLPSFQPVQMVMSDYSMFTSPTPLLRRGVVSPNRGNSWVGKATSAWLRRDAQVWPVLLSYLEALVGFVFCFLGVSGCCSM